MKSHYTNMHVKTSRYLFNMKRCFPTVSVFTSFSELSAARK